MESADPVATTPRSDSKRCPWSRAATNQRLATMRRHDHHLGRNMDHTEAEPQHYSARVCDALGYSSCNHANIRLETGHVARRNPCVPHSNHARPQKAMWPQERAPGTSPREDHCTIAAFQAEGALTAPGMPCSCARSPCAAVRWWLGRGHQVNKGIIYILQKA